MADPVARKEGADMTKKEIIAARDLCLELPRIQKRIFRAGLFKTGHAMNAAVQAIGWETAEHIETFEKEQT